MNINLAILLTIFTLASAYGDSNHSMFQEVQQMQKMQKDKDRVPNKVDESHENEDEVYEMENEPVELEMAPHHSAGPKY